MKAFEFCHKVVIAIFILVLANIEGQDCFTSGLYPKFLQSAQGNDDTVSAMAAH